MNILQVATVSQDNTNATATLAFPSAVSAGSSIVLFTSSRQTVTAVSDSKGNGYANNYLKAATASAGGFSSWLATGAAAGATTLTVTQGSTGTRPIIAAALEVDVTLQFDRAAFNFGTSNAPSVTLGVQSPGVEYLAGAMLYISTSSVNITPPLGWTRDVLKQIGTIMAGEIDHQQYTYASPLLASWGTLGTFSWQGAIAAYVPVASVPAASASFAPPPPALCVGPPMAGAPWFLPSVNALGASAPVVQDTPSQILLIPQVPAPEDDFARLAEAIRQAGALLDSLLQQGIIYQSALQQFAIRGRGMTNTRAPASTDNYAQGVGPGTVWVDRTDPNSPNVYVCTFPGSADNSVAQWARLRVLGTGSSPTGATGAF